LFSVDYYNDFICDFSGGGDSIFKQQIKRPFYLYDCINKILKLFAKKNFPFYSVYYRAINNELEKYESRNKSFQRLQGCCTKSPTSQESSKSRSARNLNFRKFRTFSPPTSTSHGYFKTII
jgi:hypothetical protein